MAFLEDVKEKATDLVQTGVAMSMQLAEIAKLKTANIREEDTIKKAYLELGKLYYAENGAIAGGAYAGACERITAAKAAIETNNDRITQLKATANVTEEADVEVEIKVTAEESNITEFPSQPASEEPKVTDEDFAETETEDPKDDL